MKKAERELIVRTLVRARTLIRKGWLQGSYAGRTPRSRSYGMDVTDKRAKCFCLSGALMRAQTNMSVVLDVRIEIGRDHVMQRYAGIVTFNDDEKTRKCDVIALLTRTIERLQK